MSLPLPVQEIIKKHKKHKRERYESPVGDKPPGLKLILKVGGQGKSFLFTV